MKGQTYTSILGPRAEVSDMNDCSPNLEYGLTGSADGENVKLISHVTIRWLSLITRITSERSNGMYRLHSSDLYSTLYYKLQNN